MRQGRFQSADGLLDEAGSVVKRHDGDFGHTAVRQGFLRKPCLDFLDFVFDVGDDGHRIGTVSGHHDGPHGFRTRLVKSATSGGGAKFHVRHILDADGNIISYCND